MLTRFSFKSGMSIKPIMIAAPVLLVATACTTNPSVEPKNKPSKSHDHIKSEDDQYQRVQMYV